MRAAGVCLGRPWRGGNDVDRRQFRQYAARRTPSPRRLLVAPSLSCSCRPCATWHTLSRSPSPAKKAFSQNKANVGDSPGLPTHSMALFRAGAIGRTRAPRWLRSVPARTSVSPGFTRVHGVASGFALPLAGDRGNGFVLARRPCATQRARTAQWVCSAPRTITPRAEPCDAPDLVLRNPSPCANAPDRRSTPVAACATWPGLRGGFVRHG
jgi:hypothetical protein